MDGRGSGRVHLRACVRIFKNLRVHLLCRFWCRHSCRQGCTTVESLWGQEWRRASQRASTPHFSRALSFWSSPASKAREKPVFELTLTLPVVSFAVSFPRLLPLIRCRRYPRANFSHTKSNNPKPKALNQSHCHNLLRHSEGEKAFEESFCACMCLLEQLWVRHEANYLMFNRLSYSLNPRS